MVGGNVGVIVLLFCLEGVDSNPDGTTTLSKAEYDAMAQKYALEFFTPVESTKPGDKSFSFYKMIGQLDPDEYEKLSRYHMSYSEVNFLDGDMIPTSTELSVILQEEMIFFTQVMHQMMEGKVDPLDVLDKHLSFIVNGALIRKRNAAYDEMNNAKDKSHAGAYIWRKLGSLGFVSGVQNFKPKQFLYSYNMMRSVPSGTNMMGIIPGEYFGTQKDKILVVGAHWDTVVTSSGYDDNASGVASILELGRALSMAECKLKYTVILVTFDLEEHGTQGSMAFVQDFLVEMLMKPMDFPGFQGAIVLDSIMSFNETKGSQRVPDDYLSATPEAAQEILDEGQKGNFIGITSREFDSQLSERFQHHWEQQSQPDWDQFKIKEFRLRQLGPEIPDPDTVGNLTNFLRSDHVRFWYSNNKDFFSSFKSIMVSDTGPSRGSMDICYHQVCDSAAFNGSLPMTRLSFLAKVTQTLIDTVVDAADEFHHTLHDNDNHHYYNNKNNNDNHHHYNNNNNNNNNNDDDNNYTTAKAVDDNNK
eukprot:maker-scaffold239_size242058-snap-gene-1.27 protein:Tk09819 transcript:maker-scaffold239_size242058-snap-gene-1.27-mRNA-1 annotation:"hypothetical protein DAPPUDRAFT_306809"